MNARTLSVPNGAAGTHSGWFTQARGAMITRRQALRVLLFGPTRAKIQVRQTQSHNTEDWS